MGAIGGCLGERVSSKKKNQHFVPRHYLKRFSFDQGSQIRLFNLDIQKYVPEAPLKSQCSSSYFYGEDTSGESILTEIEGIAEDLFGQICKDRDIPKSYSQRLDLMTVLSLMHRRTRRHAELDSGFIEVVTKRMIRMNPTLKNDSISTVLDRVRIRDRAAPLRSVKTSLCYPHLIFDLELRLIIAPAGKAFITSDHPVILLNQAFFQTVESAAICGLASKGLQIFLPISPEFLVVAFDPGLYRVGSRRRTFYQIERDEDCELINALQILNAEENLYFLDAGEIANIRALSIKFLRDRKKVDESAKPVETPAAGSARGYLIKAAAPRIPIPGKWSFCKVLKQATPNDFGLRDPGLCRLMEEHIAVIRSGRTISFDDWLAEQRAH